MKEKSFFSSKRILAVICLVLTFVLVLSACGNSGSGGGGGGDTGGEATSEAGTDTGGGTTDDNAEASGEVISLSIERPIFSNSPQGLLVEETWLRETEAYLGVQLNINFIEIGFGDYQERLPTFLAAGEWADIFYAGNNIDVLNDFGMSGMILNLKDFPDETTHYFRKLQEVDYTPITASDDGLYVFTSLLYSTNIGTQVIIKANVDAFLDNGLQAPTTTEELYEISVRLKEIYPDTFPIAGGGGNGGMYWDWVHRAFGIGQGVFFDGTQFDYAPRTDEYREALAFTHRLYSEGLIDPEFYTMTDDEYFAKCLTGRSFIGFGWGSQVFERINSAFDEYGVLFGYLPNMTGIPGQLPYSPFDNPGETVLDNFFAVVNARTQHPEIAMRIVDFQYSEEMLNLFNWGIEDVTYIYNPDGSRTMVDEIMNAPNPSDAMAEFGINTSYSVRSGIQFVPQDRDVPALVFPPTPAWINGNFDTMTTSWAYYHDLIMEGAAQRRPQTPVLRWGEVEVEQRNLIRTALDTFANEERIKFIRGERSLSEWDVYLTELNNFGDIEQLLRLFNDKLN